jgi:hypothetical protein
MTDSKRCTISSLRSKPREIKLAEMNRGAQECTLGHSRKLIARSDGKLIRRVNYETKQ